MSRTSLLARLAIAVALVSLPAATSGQPSLAGRAVWAHPRDAGTTEASVRAFVEQLARAHVNTVVMEVKTTAGLFWPSRASRRRSSPDYRDVRLPRRADSRGARPRHPGPRVVLRLRRGRRLPRREGTSRVAGPAAQTGRPTTSEVLRGRPYRPGVDVPGASARLHRPVADSAHHRVRRALRRRRDSPRLRALPRRPRARHLLLLRLLPEGACPSTRSYLLAGASRRSAGLALRSAASRGALGAQPEGAAGQLGSVLARDEEPFPARRQLLPGGHRDLDYFFYEYRAHHIAEFTRDVFEADPQGEAPHRGVGGRVQEPRAERPVHRAGLAAVLALGPAT